MNNPKHKEKCCARCYDCRESLIYRHCDEEDGHWKCADTGISGDCTCPCHTPQDTQEEWEKEFIRRFLTEGHTAACRAFGIVDNHANCHFFTDKDDGGVLKFIRETIARIRTEERERIIKIVDASRTSDELGGGIGRLENHARWQAITDIIAAALNSPEDN